MERPRVRWSPPYLWALSFALGVVFSCPASGACAQNSSQHNISRPSNVCTVRNQTGTWECIPPAYRPEGANLDTTAPDPAALKEGLLYMTMASSAECVRRLLDAGASVNAVTVSPHPTLMDGPPLHLALRQRHWEIARILISRKADANVIDAGNATALDEACSNGAPSDIVSRLREMGAKMKMFGPGICAQTGE